jgi:pimeloyl-ACP methyl ester carboxylesterase
LFWDWPGKGRVRYLRAGETGPLLLLVPGFGISSADFLGNIRPLAEQGYRVYAVDLLGLGESVPDGVAVAKSITVSTWRNQVGTFAISESRFLLRNRNIPVLEP